MYLKNILIHIKNFNFGRSIVNRFILKYTTLKIISSFNSFKLELNVKSCVFKFWIILIFYRFNLNYYTPALILYLLYDLQVLNFKYVFVVIRSLDWQKNVHYTIQTSQERCLGAGCFYFMEMCCTNCVYYKSWSYVRPSDEHWPIMNTYTLPMHSSCGSWKGWGRGLRWPTSGQ